MLIFDYITVLSPLQKRRPSWPSKHCAALLIVFSLISPS